MSRKLSSSLERQHKIWQQNQEKRRKLIKRSAAITLSTALLAARLMTPFPVAQAETTMEADVVSSPTQIAATDNFFEGMSDDMSDEMFDGMYDEMSDEMSDGMYDDMSDEMFDEMSDEMTDENTDGIDDYSMFDFSDESSDEFMDDNSDEMSFDLLARGENMTMLRVGKEIYFVNDERSRLDAAPMVENGRTLLPLRFVAQAMGGEVSWDSSDQKVTIVKDEDVIHLWIGSNLASVNGDLEWIDPDNESVKAVVVPGANRTMVPVKFVAEALGADIFWDQDTKTITIKY